MDQLSPETLNLLFRQLLDSNVTKTVHRTVYPALSPSRPELRQDGRVVLVTGGGTNIGFSIARAFVRAGAETVIIIGRREDVLRDASLLLEEEAKSVGSSTIIVSRPMDVTDPTQTVAFWRELADQDISVDVFVSNVAKFSEEKTILELGADEVWSQVEVNAKAPLYWIEQFHRQAAGGQKFLINVSTAVHMTGHPGFSIRPAYCMSKMFGTLVFQDIALTTPPENMQIVSFHPGSIWSAAWEAMGLGLKPENFNNVELPGAFAVWLATKAAAFLHGRFVWSSWDVEELASGDIRKRIDSDFYFLKSSVVGLDNGMLAK